MTVIAVKDLLWRELEAEAREMAKATHGEDVKLSRTRWGVWVTVYGQHGDVIDKFEIEA